MQLKGLRNIFIGEKREKKLLLIASFFCNANQKWNCHSKFHRVDEACGRKAAAQIGII